MRRLELLKELIAFAITFFLFITLAFAQTKTISGTVTDQTGKGVPGVTVSVKGTSTSTQTDANGAYRINAPGDAILVFSSVGYTTAEMPVGAKTTIDVPLKASDLSLSEVVVIGYGTARRKDLTGAVSSVKAKDFNQGIIIAPDQLLQGKVPGLEITVNSGQPGAATTVKIRGNNSIRTNNNPLYVIDGVPLDGRTARPSLELGSSFSLDFGVTPESNPLLYINPYDIAQIDVLKDASAAAIYGSRGANGIIVITTKRGTTGTHVEFGADWGRPIGYMKKYKVLTADEFRTETKKNNFSFDSSASVDALDAITQHKITQNYHVALSGGNEAGKFRASFLGSRNEGFVKKTSLDKYIGDFSGQYKFIDNRLSIDFSLIGGHTIEHMALISNTPGAGGNLMAYALNWNPTKSFTTSNGLFSPASNSIPNPLAVLDGFDDIANVNVFLGNISAGVKLTDFLDYKFLYAINHGSGERKTNADGWIDGIQGLSGTGFAAISNATLTSQTFTHTLNYRTNFTPHLTFDATLGYEYWKSDFTNSTVGGSQFNTNLDQANRINVPYTSIFQNAKTQFPLKVQVDPTTEIQSYFGRVNFNLQNKYYLTSTFRADGSNKFGKNNKYGYFPSVGAKWVISNEDFMKGTSFLNNLALRGSWGITGNQEFPTGASLEQFNSGAYNSIGQSNVANPDLKWEKTTSYDIGLEYSLFNGRVYGSVDYYHKNTTDLLFQDVAIQPAPASIFFINLPANLINKGVEFGIGAAIINGQHFGWDAALNLAYNKNKLTNFSRSIPTGKVSGQGVSGALSQIITNDQPVNEFYLKKFSGFDQNGQPIVADQPSFAGDPNPHLTYGFSTNLRYDKWSFSLNAGGATGFLIYNNTFTSVTNVSNLQKGQNVSAEIIGSKESLNSSVAASTRYLEKGNYLKLRNATLSYNVGNIGSYFKNLNVFVTGTNLFVITKFTGFDPEVNIDKNNNNYPSRSIEFIPYPTARMLSAGFNCAF